MLFRPLRHVVPGLALALALGCSSVGSGFGGQRLVVGLYDARNSVQLELANEEHPELGDIYSQRQSDASLKLASAELMEALLADLDTLGFSRLAKPGLPPPSGAADRSVVAGLPPDSAGGPANGPAALAQAQPEAPTPPGGLRGWVTVRQGSHSRTFVVPASGGTAEQLQAFVSMKLLMDAYYGQVGGLQFVTNPEGSSIFRKQP